MSNLIAIVGNSGSGKSTSFRTLDPKETFVINVASKPLPFRGWKTHYTAFNKDNPTGNYLATSDVSTINKILLHVDAKRPEIKNIIVDDKQ